ncbi:MAG: universal stress protein [Pegethrix bostrychoides GSE-TBD4-15B]|jgi:nucleotide-binding universal stress UspA family protein|uniref:Universal stress protein n=1 Tax=Pegethrix bostrychoides GSE-TBD4-15B TaxID=2839662 RepID=A0A951P7A4_9CYAN|nr:universal stress protein [Pegethrix bostrychoides GSE-TBD4-15B]
MYKTVLFPIDQSRESREASGTVAEIVKMFESKLVLLSVVESPDKEPETVAAGIMASAEAIAQLLADAKALFESKGIEAEIIEREGNPAFVICDVADELEADLIIMGSRGLGLTNTGATESVANRVINLAPCPVMIVP